MHIERKGPLLQSIATKGLFLVQFTENFVQPLSEFLETYSIFIYPLKPRRPPPENHTLRYSFKLKTPKKYKISKILF